MLSSLVKFEGHLEGLGLDLGLGSLQAKALRVGDGDGQFQLQFLPASVRRQADLVEARVRDRQPERTQRRRGQRGHLRPCSHCCWSEVQ